MKQWLTFLLAFLGGDGGNGNGVCFVVWEG